MGDTNFDNPFDSDSDDRGDLVWNEFDWERYLREHDEVVIRYLGFYERCMDRSDRLDEAARLMGWVAEGWTTEGVLDEGGDEAEGEVEADDDESGAEEEPYTQHKNPVYIATRALFLGLKRAWENLCDVEGRVPHRLILGYYAPLLRTEEQAMQAVAALDFGDYALAISLFKRALREFNAALAALDEGVCASNRDLAHYRDQALVRLFDLREVWLRVMAQCREELARPPAEADDVDEDDED